MKQHNSNKSKLNINNRRKSFLVWRCSTVAWFIQTFMQQTCYITHSYLRMYLLYDLRPRSANSQCFWRGSATIYANYIFFGWATIYDLCANFAHLLLYAYLSGNYRWIKSSTWRRKHTESQRREIMTLPRVHKSFPTYRRIFISTDVSWNNVTKEENAYSPFVNIFPNLFSIRVIRDFTRCFQSRLRPVVSVRLNSTRFYVRHIWSRRVLQYYGN